MLQAPLAVLLVLRYGVLPQGSAFVAGVVRMEGEKTQGVVTSKALELDSNDL